VCASWATWKTSSLSLEQAKSVRAAGRASVSLDEPVGDEQDAVLADFVAGVEPPPEEEVEVALRRDAVRRGVGLPARPRATDDRAALRARRRRAEDA
jgi:DNA-directed RNA polymerase sigma subunit (sigma70/sigma32)